MRHGVSHAKAICRFVVWSNSHSERNSRWLVSLATNLYGLYVSSSGSPSATGKGRPFRRKRVLCRRHIQLRNGSLPAGIATSCRYRNAVVKCLRDTFSNPRSLKFWISQPSARSHRCP